MKLSPTFSYYIIRVFLTWFFIILFSISFIIVLVEFSELLRRVSGNTNTNYLILLKISFLKLPYIIEKLLPFCIFFSSVIAFWNLSRHQELTIIRSVGVPIWPIIFPITSCCLIIGILDLFIINPFTVSLKIKHDTLINKTFNVPTESVTLSDSNIWALFSKQDETCIFRINKINKKQSILYNLSIFSIHKEQSLVKRIDAQNAKINNGLLIMKNVWITEKEQLPLYKDTYTIKSNISLEKLEKSKHPPELMSFLSLSKYITLLKKSGLSALPYLMYWHSLIARCLLLGTMVILAATTTSNLIQQRKVFFLIGTSIFISFSIYIFLDITYALGLSSSVPLHLAAWAPFVVSTMVSLFILLHLEES